MGFGFNLFVIFVLPVIFFLSLVVFAYGYGNGINCITKIIKWIWILIIGFIIGLMFLSYVLGFFFEKKKFTRKDIYGSYIINRNAYKGINADWQYNHYRFEITKRDSFIFYITNGNQVNKTYRGKIYFGTGYGYRINIKPKLTTNLIDSIPTLYKKPFSFYYVMSNTPYGNMFYKKGQWKPID